MKLETVRQILDCQVIAGGDKLGDVVTTGCGADLMSDVLAFIKPNALLLTGLATVQSVRTADVAEVKGIVYVRGKWPEADAVELAKEKGIVLLATKLPMYESCGKLWASGLPGGGELAGDRGDACGAPVPATV